MYTGETETERDESRKEWRNCSHPRVFGQVEEDGDTA